MKTLARELEMTQKRLLKAILTTLPIHLPEDVAQDSGSTSALAEAGKFIDWQEYCLGGCNPRCGRSLGRTRCKG